MYNDSLPASTCGTHVGRVVVALARREEPAGIYVRASSRQLADACRMQTLHCHGLASSWSPSQAGRCQFRLASGLMHRLVVDSR